jgi:uncharacterized surface protein with fasciclin (FAS1) repeats
MKNFGRFKDSNLNGNFILCVGLVTAIFSGCGGSTPGLVDSGVTADSGILSDGGLTDAGLTADAGPMLLSIVATASATPNLSTLVSALRFASDSNDLVTQLDSPGTFTVLAPTNDAFDKLAAELTGLPGAKGTDLLTVSNRQLIKNILIYHLVPSVLKAANIPFGKAITSVEGSIFKIDSAVPPLISDGRNRTSNITSADILASNGVIHVIDKVLLPADKDLLETAQALATATPGEFTVLVEAVLAADLQTRLKGAAPLTLFAPTDAAFAALLIELNMSKTMLFADKPFLTRVLNYHLVSGRVLKVDLVGTSLTTLQTGQLNIDATLKITDARNRSPKPGITKTDVLAKNGVIHTIDKVLLPAP